MIDKNVIRGILLIGILIGFALGLSVSQAFAEEVSCRYLEANNLGNYFVSEMPNGEHELRFDYWEQRNQCLLDKEINNTIKEKDSWFNW